MNIFVTNDDPIIAAQDLCDKHVRSKMQIESAIMLAHAFNQDTLNDISTPRTKSGKPRKSGKGYYNHQCSVWVRESRSNFMWLVNHALEMFRERQYRWPQSTEHFTHSFIQWCKNNVHNTIIPDKGLTPFAVAINEECECRKTVGFNNLPVVEQYREYIRKDKPFVSWTRRNKPIWF